MENGIKTSGCLHASTQRLFEDSPRGKATLVFDFPGEFTSFRDYIFKNMSFREEGTLLGTSNFSVFADVEYKSSNLGRSQILEATSFFYKPSSREFCGALYGRNLPLEQLEVFLDSFVEDPLNDWINSRRRYNEKGIGIPERIYQETDLSEVGFLNPAYFNQHVFVNPYVVVRSPTLTDRISKIVRELTKGTPAILNQSHRRTIIGDRVNLLDTKVEEIYDPETETNIGLSFEALTKYALGKPLVPREQP